MSAASCPGCGKPIDTVRARVVRVRGGAVIGYCSVACADGKPVARGEPVQGQVIAPAP